MRHHSTETDLFGEPILPKKRKPRPPTVNLPGLTEKPCVDCKTVLPIDDFRWNTGSDGRKRRDSLCRLCRNRRMREWWNDPANARKKKASRMKRTYGFTIEQYDTMFSSQGGACAICGATSMPIDPRTGKSYELAVDHDHATGGVRALLCPDCNNGLGCFKDSEARLHEAINYLQRHSV